MVPESWKYVFECDLTVLNPQFWVVFASNKSTQKIFLQKDPESKPPDVCCMNQIPGFSLPHSAVRAL